MDQIVGISVLIPTDEKDPHGCGYLHYLAQRTDGSVFIDYVAVMPKKNWTSESKPWAYTVEGDTIHGSPSINDIDRHWHNAFNWSTKFVLYTPELAESNGTTAPELMVRNINWKIYSEVKYGF